MVNRTVRFSKPPNLNFNLVFLINLMDAYSVANYLKLLSKQRVPRRIRRVAHALQQDG